MKNKGLKVYIDDIREKPKNFDVKVSTLKNFILILLTNKVDLISFDHDFDGYAIDGNDFAEIAVKLWQEGSIKRFDWKVHSANPVGADRIRHTLEAID